MNVGTNSNRPVAQKLETNDNRLGDKILWVLTMVSESIACQANYTIYS